MNHIDNLEILARTDALFGDCKFNGHTLCNLVFKVIEDASDIKAGELVRAVLNYNFVLDNNNNLRMGDFPWVRCYLAEEIIKYRNHEIGCIKSYLINTNKLKRI